MIEWDIHAFILSNQKLSNLLLVRIFNVNERICFKSMNEIYID